MPPRFDMLLDLDETLLFASEEPLARPPAFIAEPFHVYKRPGVDRFLATCCEWFRVGVWTSGSESYAKMITNHLFPDPGRLAFVWANDRCTWKHDVEAQSGEWIKDLKKLKKKGYALEKILFVDDTPEKMVRNFGNHIAVRAFDGDPDDTELDVLLVYLETLGPLENVRTVEKRNWRRGVK